MVFIPTLKRNLLIVLAVFVFALVQIVWWQIGTWQQDAHLQRLLMTLQIPADLSAPLYLQASPELTLTPTSVVPEAAIAVSMPNGTLWVDERLMLPRPFALLIVVDFALLAFLSAAVWFKRRELQLQAAAIQVKADIEAALVQVQLPVAPDCSASELVQSFQAYLQQQQRRDDEIRQLVRVQGLLDLDLLIGNRIYFESKLQFYLSDADAPASGGLFIAQITHPEGEISSEMLNQRLAGCIELVQQLTTGFDTAILARIAEQDLALLIPGMEQKDAANFGDRMAMILSRGWFFPQQNLDVVHVGFVEYQQEQTLYQVMAEADMALKTAQLQGPNAAFGFSPAHKPPVHGSLWWRTELTQALQQHRFVLHFQPVFSWQQQDVLQHEVLVRLNSSDGERLDAAEFLPMAVNCGMSSQIDQFVLSKAAKLLAQEVGNPPRCSVNLSVHTLLSADFLPWLESQCQQGMIVAQQFALEFNEHHTVRLFAKLQPKLLRLNQLGFALIIDHAGLTLEQQAMLPDLPLHSVKLHPSVVRHVEQQPEQQLYIRGLVNSYHKRGVSVLATGVEYEAECKTLQRLGVSGAQGYFFSRPLAQLRELDPSS